MSETIVFKVVREMPDGRLVSPNIEGLWQVVYLPEALVFPPDPAAFLFAYRSQQSAQLQYHYHMHSTPVDQTFQLWRAGATVVQEGPEWVPQHTEKRFFRAYWQGQYYRETMGDRKMLMPTYCTMLAQCDTVLCSDLRLYARLT